MDWTQIVVLIAANIVLMGYTVYRAHANTEKECELDELGFNLTKWRVELRIREENIDAREDELDVVIAEEEYCEEDDDE